MNTPNLISDFLTHIGHGLVDNTRASRLQSMNQFLEYFQETDVASIGSKELGAWMLWLAEVRNNKPQSISIKLTVVKRFFTWLADQNLIPDRNLDAFIPRRLPKLVIIPASRKGIDEDEQRHIMAVISSGRVKRWWQTASLVGWHCGLRLSDIATLRWDGIDWENEIVNVTPIKTKRLGKTVSIPMDEELVEHLANLKANPPYPTASPHVIPDMAGYYDIPNLGRKILTEQFKYIVKIAGHKALHFHCYRHGFVSRLINAGVDPIIIASMTAQSLDQISRYAHVSTDAKREALSKARAALHRAKLRQRGVTPKPMTIDEPVHVS